MVAPRITQAKRTKQVPKTECFVWKPKDWTLKDSLTESVSVLANRSNTKLLIVKKVVSIESNSANDERPLEARALSMIPNCNRILKPIFCSKLESDHRKSMILFTYYPLGDLSQWRWREFNSKNNKTVPESYIWRCFLQMSQALAFLQNYIGPDIDERDCMLHRDIKPKNIIVIDNGTTYPSFKLHDFDCAMIYHTAKACRPARCGTYSWQPPENPIINTKAADIWALGACIHYLALGFGPVEDALAWGEEQFADVSNDPESVVEYSDMNKYLMARVPRHATPINLSQEQQQKRGIGPDNHQYSDELAGWLSNCLSYSAGQRPKAARLVDRMGPEAKTLLREMGGKAALVDLEAKFGVNA